MPSLAIAFIAVAVGLGGFALAYSSTLIRSAADQAADRVPLDALVSPGADFSTPLELAPLQRWQALAAGAVLPIRRTDANYTSGAGTVTVPALGVPAAGLIQIHGWRESDGSAPLAALARRLEPTGPVRLPGPMLPAVEVLTQAGIGRRARVRPTPDGVIVTRADSDSGPPGSAGSAGSAGLSPASARPQPPVLWAPVKVELCSVARTYGHGLTRRDVLGGLTHDFAPGQLTAITGRSGRGKRRC